MIYTNKLVQLTIALLLMSSTGGCNSMKALKSDDGILILDGKDKVLEYLHALFGMYHLRVELEGEEVFLQVAHRGHGRV